MNAGRIAPIFRHFFQTTTSTKSAPDSHSQNQQDRREPDREPTRDEALEALDVLSQQEEFQKNALKAELSESEGKFSIIIRNGKGHQLKVIRGGEILRVLETAGLGRNGPHLGRILDRRI